MEIGTFEHDDLFAGQHPAPATSVGTILQGEGTAGVVPRGAVLGKVTAGAVPTTGTAGGGDTGTGTCASVTGGKKVKAGTYTLTCIDAQSNAGVFKVVNPLGEQIGTARVGVAFTSPEINFTISDATDFIAGDSFTIVVPAGSGMLRWVNAANVDGSANPYAVLGEKQTVAADEDMHGAPLYLQGHFNSDKLTFKGGGDTVAVHKDALRALNILTSKNLVA